MTAEARRHLTSCFGKRKRRKYEISSLFLDSDNPHETDAANDICNQYTIHVHRSDNGLASCAQMADDLFINDEN